MVRQVSPTFIALAGSPIMPCTSSNWMVGCELVKWGTSATSSGPCLALSALNAAKSAIQMLTAAENFGGGGAPAGGGVAGAGIGGTVRNSKRRMDFP